MKALFAGLATLDISQLLDHIPSITKKTQSIDSNVAAGGPATNAAATFAALQRCSNNTKDPESHANDNSNGFRSAALASVLGRGQVAQLLTDDIAHREVQIIDCTDENQRNTSPSFSSIIEHPEGRMVTSTPPHARSLPHEQVLSLIQKECPTLDVLLLDGHHPQISLAAVLHGATIGETGCPASIDDAFETLSLPTWPRVLDGGSWKPWLTSLLPFIDIAIVSADFYPPMCQRPEDVADFLTGFSINRVIRTNGSEPVQWWWEGERGEYRPNHVHAVSTSGAGDVFHGAFAWALAHEQQTNTKIPSDPTQLIAFSSSVAELSIQHFGGSTWESLPEVTALVDSW